MHYNAAAKALVMTLSFAWRGEFILLASNKKKTNSQVKLLSNLLLTSDKLKISETADKNRATKEPATTQNNRLSEVAHTHTHSQIKFIFYDTAHKDTFV